MGCTETLFNSQTREHFAYAKEKVQQKVLPKIQHSSWTLLAIAGLISGGCYDSAAAANSIPGSGIEHTASAVIHPLTEFAIAAGISKTLDITGRKKEEAEVRLQKVPGTELLPDHALFLPNYEPSPLSAA